MWLRLLPLAPAPQHGLVCCDGSIHRARALQQPSSSLAPPSFPSPAARSRPPAAAASAAAPRYRYADLLLRAVSIDGGAQPAG